MTELNYSLGTENAMSQGGKVTFWVNDTNLYADVVRYIENVLCAEKYRRSHVNQVSHIEVPDFDEE